MNKKTFLMAFAVAASAIAVTSCDNSAKKEAEPVAVQTNPIELKIAYVEVDSIMSQYQFCKDYSLVLQKKSQNIQNTLQQKAAALQNAAANFQQKLQQNAYTEQQADLEALQQRLGNELQAENEKFNTALHDSIQNFLAAYNKDKKYTLILSKAGDNILYADKAHDITRQVVAGLNKAYKKPADLGKSAAKKDDKK